MPDEAKPACPICNDEGRIEVVDGDEIRFRQCSCAYAKAMKKHIVSKGSLDLAVAPVITQSPLYTQNAEGVAVIDRTKENLFIKGSWLEVRPHLKWTLVCKGLNYNFIVVTDEMLKRVYVGDESKKNKPKNKEDLDSFNNLSHLIGADHPLVIIRLGFLGYKNIAMAGLFKEALRHREAASLPTWIIEDDPEYPFDPGHRAWSEEVWSYIVKNFQFVDLTGTLEEPAPRQKLLGTPKALPSPEEVVEVEGGGIPQEVRQLPPDEHDDDNQPGMALDDMSVLGGGNQKRKTSRYKGRSGGGGPLGGF